MKRTDIAKLNAVKLLDRMKSASTPGRYGKASGDSERKTTVSPLVEKLLGKKAANKAAE